MQKAEGQPAKGPRNWIFWACLLAGVFVVIGSAFIGGLYAGRWAVKSQVRLRIEQRWTLWRNAKSTPAVSIDASGEWREIDTALVRMQASEIHLPKTDVDGWGGGIQPLDDGRIFYATRTGQFGVIGTDGVVDMLPFSVDMNLDALKRHPVSKIEDFNFAWFRVTDINLTPIGAGRYELLVGHHYFEPQQQCIELKLSRAVLSVSGKDISLAEPFRTILTTKPCITFNLPDYEFPFEGHFSGGRIARFGANQVLFSTGDHGWVGLRGYPALAQDDDSTLGKVLLVNLSTNEVSVFAKGFRNPQGLTIDSNGHIWLTDQGPQGGDELNLIVKGQNYGWPESTYGTDYGPKPWPMSAVQGRYDMGTKPDFAWNPSIATSNLIEAKGNEFPLWKGDLLVSSLGGEAIHRLRLDGTRVVYDEPIKMAPFRLRDIVELPTGRIALLTDPGIVILLRNGDGHIKTPYLDPKSQQRRTTDMSIQQRAIAVAGRYANPAEAVAEASKQLPAAAARGQAVFNQNCAICHSLNTAMSFAGPSLKGVIGRRVGSTNYAYSGALVGRHDTWTGPRIVDFAVKPSGIYPGTSMPPVPMPPDLQHDLESYLEASSR